MKEECFQQYFYKHTRAAYSKELSIVMTSCPVCNFNRILLSIYFTIFPHGC